MQVNNFHKTIHLIFSFIAIEFALDQTADSPLVWIRDEWNEKVYPSYYFAKFEYKPMDRMLVT